MIKVEQPRDRRASGEANRQQRRREIHSATAIGWRLMNQQRNRQGAEREGKPQEDIHVSVPTPAGDEVHNSTIRSDL